jgi:hypothetical protein
MGLMWRIIKHTQLMINVALDAYIIMSGNDSRTSLQVPELTRRTL